MTFNQSTQIFLRENASENIVPGIAAILSRGKWVNVSLSKDHEAVEHGNRRMMASSNGRFVRVTIPLYGECTCHRWNPLKKGHHCGLWSVFVPPTKSAGNIVMVSVRLCVCPSVRPFARVCVCPYRASDQYLEKSLIHSFQIRRRHLLGECSELIRF